jgi:hypothetical protein
MIVPTVVRSPTSKRVVADPRPVPVYERPMRINYFVCLLVIGCGGGTSQAPAPRAAPVAAASGDTEDCRVLRERVTTASVRLQALNNGEATAAHYLALGDVMDKLARDLDRPFTDSSVQALASDYKEAGRAVVTASHEVAELLEKGEAAVAVIKKPDGVTARLLQQVQRIAEDCKGSSAADCARVVEAIRGLDAVASTSANVQTAIGTLGGVTFTTKKLKEHTADVTVSLGEIRDALATGEQIDKDVHAKVTAYERSVGLLRGLNQRGDQLCPAK